MFFFFFFFFSCVLSGASPASSLPVPRPFAWSISAKQRQDLDTRLANAVFPRFHRVADRNDTSGGMSISFMRDLVEQWRKHDFDALERKLSDRAFTVDVDSDTTLYFRHLKAHPSSQQLNQTVLLLHGWPGSVLEFDKAAARLTGYNVVIPSLPGFGLSSHGFGMNLAVIASKLQKLMRILGYDSYVVQGGDLGAMAAIPLCESDVSCKGIHVNFLPLGPPFRKGLSGLLHCIKSYLFPSWCEEPDLVMRSLVPFRFLWWYFGYLHEHSTRPLTLSYSLADSPLGLAAWMAEKFLSWKQLPISMSDIVDSVSLYWFTRSGGSHQIYFEEFGDIAAYLDRSSSVYITKPFAYTSTQDLARVPRDWLSFYAADVHAYERQDTVGHFYALEDPVGFVIDLTHFVTDVYDAPDTQQLAPMDDNHGEL